MNFCTHIHILHTQFQFPGTFMNKFLLTFLLLITGSVCSAQIAPPKQIDTLFITSIRHDEFDIPKDQWPFEIICKSKSDFTIGDSTYSIFEVNKWGKTSHYSIRDNKKRMMTELWLTTGNLNKFTLVLFDGYEISCISSKYIPVEKFNTQPCVTTCSMDGRDLESVEFPDFVCHADGEVTILVQVDRTGKVTGTKVLDDVSDQNKCLRYFATRSASLAKFSPSENAPELQYGEIVYEFKRDKSSKEKKYYAGLREKYPWLP